MVRLKAPLMSLEASGTIGGSVVFAKWKGRDYARRHAIPANPHSALQTAVRAVFKFLAQDWVNIVGADRTAWTTAAAADNITALNAMIRHDIDLARRGLGIVKSTVAAGGAIAAAPTAGVITAQPKTLVVPWTPSVSANANYAQYVYRKVGGAPAPGFGELVAVVTQATTSITDRGLLTGSVYHYKVVAVSASGELSAASADFSGTPT